MGPMAALGVVGVVVLLVVMVVRVVVVGVRVRVMVDGVEARATPRSRIPEVGIGIHTCPKVLETRCNQSHLPHTRRICGRGPAAALAR